jgi:hypothetical protein
MIRRYCSLSPGALLAVGLTLAIPAGAQYSSSSGMYFHSAGAAYMNTLSWSTMSRSPEMAKAMNDAAARVNGGEPRVGNSPPAPTSSSAPGLSASDFTPVVEERGKVIDLLVAQLPAGAGRDRQRARIEGLSTTVENSANRKHNLAEVTYLLIGVSLRTATGRPMENARVQELVRAIAAAYAADSGFKRLDDRLRSRMYYLYTAVIALTGGLSASKDPAEVQAARLLARNTLSAMGIKL